MMRLHLQGKLGEHHLEAAAKFESLVYCGYGTKSISPDMVHITPSRYHANLNGLRLSRLCEEHARVLMRVLIFEESVAAIGFSLGACSRTNAYRLGLDALRAALTHAAVVL